jgi:CDP-diacylglycerol---glycerol-3-phosphate 3-phosphatidyltransferase
MIGIYRVKPAFQRSLRGIEDWLILHRVHPDVLTYAALVLSVVGGAALYLAPEQTWLLGLVPIVAVLRTALNALDGLVAKRTGLARPWGEIINEFCDRLADVALFGAVALAAPSAHLLGASVVVLMLLTSYLAILSKAAGGARQYAGPMGKADRMILLTLFSVLGLFLPMDLTYNALLGVMLAGLLVTLIQRARLTYSDLESAR